MIFTATKRSDKYLLEQQKSSKSSSSKKTSGKKSKRHKKSRKHNYTESDSDSDGKWLLVT